MEWVPFLTVKLVDDFAAHLKLFGLALEHCEKQKEEGSRCSCINWRINVVTGTCTI